MGIPARPKFRRWNYRLYLPAKWRGGGSTSPYLFREHYEPELMLLERFLKPGMVFVDGGANTGVFAFTAARLVGPTGRVLAFEPGSACFAALTQSRALNQFEQLRLVNKALSDQSGTARLYHCMGQENAFSLGAENGATFDEISTTTLDEIAQAEQLPRVDFIKLDVEGAEELVLRGAKQVLETFAAHGAIRSESGSIAAIEAGTRWRLPVAARTRLSIIFTRRPRGIDARDVAAGTLRQPASHSARKNMIDQGKHSVLGVRIDAVDYDAAVDRIMTAAREQRPMAISALAVHGVMTGVLNSTHRYRLNQFDLLVPDGQPVRWALSWLHGAKLADRVYGPNLMLELCRRASVEHLPIFLFGGDSQMLAALQESIERTIP